MPPSENKGGISEKQQHVLTVGGTGRFVLTEMDVKSESHQRWKEIAILICRTVVVFTTAALVTTLCASFGAVAGPVGTVVGGVVGLGVGLTVGQIIGDVLFRDYIPPVLAM